MTGSIMLHDDMVIDQVGLVKRVREALELAHHGSAVVHPPPHRLQAKGLDAGFFASAVTGGAGDAVTTLAAVAANAVLGHTPAARVTPRRVISYARSPCFEVVAPQAVCEASVASPAPSVRCVVA